MRRSIFITGAGSGIGRAVAQYFATRGWFVGLADINEQGMAETGALLPVDQSHSHVLDVRDRSEWDRALAEFSAMADGRIDVVFNNAGIGIGGALVELDRDEIDDLIDINFRGMIYGAQAAYSYLKASAPKSVLVNTSSAAGNYGTGGMALYSATKCAVRGLTEALDIEWHADGIKVCALMPGIVETGILNGMNNRKSNVSRRASAARAGFEVVPIEQVAEAVWQAANGDTRLRYQIGRTARQLAFAARWMPGLLRRRLIALMVASKLGGS